MQRGGLEFGGGGVACRQKGGLVPEPRSKLQTPLYDLWQARPNCMPNPCLRKVVSKALVRKYISRNELQKQADKIGLPEFEMTQ